jgi:hypothetical protein
MDSAVVVKHLDAQGIDGGLIIPPLAVLAERFVDIDPIKLDRMRFIAEALTSSPAKLRELIDEGCLGLATGIFQVDKFNDDKSELLDTVRGHNVFLTTGITELWKLVYGNVANHFDNTNARIGVGTSTTAPAAAQTDIITAGVYKAMNASYPQMSGKDILFQSDFLTGEANQAWAEMVVKQNTSAVCLNRSTNGGSGWGTKASGTWTITATLSIT